MRQFRVLLIVSALVGAGALTGCFGKDDEGDGGDTNTSTGGGAGGAGGAGGGAGGAGGGAGGAGGNGTTPPPPPPPRPVNETYSLTLAPAVPPTTAPQAEQLFNVPAGGWRSFTVTAKANGPNAQAPFIADGIDVSVLDPAGTEVGKVSFAAGPVAAEQTITVASGGAGEYKVVAKAKTQAVSATVTGTIAVTY